MPFTSKPKTILTKKDIQRMLGKAFEKFPNEDDLRSVSSLVSFLWLSGCRISEALNVKREDVVLEENLLTVRIIPLKTANSYRKDETVFPFGLSGDRKKDEFVLWIKVQAKNTEPGKRLWDFHRMTAWRYLVSLMPSIYPHRFRHTRATILADRGAADAQLRKWFGWSRQSKMPYNYTEKSRIQMLSISKLLEEN